MKLYFVTIAIIITLVLSSSSISASGIGILPRKSGTNATVQTYVDFVFNGNVHPSLKTGTFYADIDPTAVSREGGRVTENLKKIIEWGEDTLLTSWNREAAKAMLLYGKFRGRYRAYTSAIPDTLTVHTYRWNPATQEFEAVSRKPYPGEFSMNIETTKGIVRLSLMVCLNDLRLPPVVENYRYTPPAPAATFNIPDHIPITRNDATARINASSRPGGHQAVAASRKSNAGGQYSNPLNHLTIETGAKVKNTTIVFDNSQSQTFASEGSIIDALRKQGYQPQMVERTRRGKTNWLAVGVAAAAGAGLTWIAYRLINGRWRRHAWDGPVGRGPGTGWWRNVPYQGPGTHTTGTYYTSGGNYFPPASGHAWGNNVSGARFGANLRGVRIGADGWPVRGQGYFTESGRERAAYNFSVDNALQLSNGNWGNYVQARQLLEQAHLQSTDPRGYFW